MNEGWINGGFMICSINILNLIKNDKTILEKDILKSFIIGITLCL